MEKIKRLIIDPEGFVVLQFESFNDLADFIRDFVPSGIHFRNMRTKIVEPFSISWKLEDMPAPLHLESKQS